MIAASAGLKVSGVLAAVAGSAWVLQTMEQKGVLSVETLAITFAGLCLLYIGRVALVRSGSSGNWRYEAV